jgi:hypothetical protein
MKKIHFEGIDNYITIKPTRKVTFECGQQYLDYIMPIILNTVKSKIQRGYVCDVFVYDKEKLKELLN